MRVCECINYYSFARDLIRAYPPAYGAAVASAFGDCPLSPTSIKAPTPAAVESDRASSSSSNLTDREIFLDRVNSTTDLWDDANLGPVLRYLRGNRHLTIPDSWYDTVNFAMTRLTN